MEYSKNSMTEMIKDLFVGMYGEEAAKKLLSAKPQPRKDLPISPKENFKLLLDHKKPMYFPIHSDIAGILPNAILERPANNRGGKDWFGVEWDYVPSAGSPMVKPNSELFEDMSNWKESIDIPDLDAIDWEASAKEIEPFYDEDKLSSFLVMNGPFERLHSFMGIENAFIAFYEEPEAVHEYMEFITEYKIKLLGKMIDHYKVDIIQFHDDWGCNKNGFFPAQMFEEFIYPYMKRIVQYVKQRGVYFDMHSCGKVDLYIPYMVKMGCDMWNPAQCLNDLANIKKQYGDKLVICGGMDDYFLDSATITEEELHQYARDKIDLLGAGGGYLPRPNAKTLKNNGILTDEVAKYTAGYYD